MKHVPSSVCFCTHCNRYTGYQFKEIEHCIISRGRYTEDNIYFAICKDCRNKLEFHWLNMLNKALGDDKYYDALTNDETTDIKICYCDSCKKYSEYKFCKVEIEMTKDFYITANTIVCKECGKVYQHHMMINNPYKIIGDISENDYHIKDSINLDAINFRTQFKMNYIEKFKRF